ncbi:MAG: VOC family protein [Caulobacteraceae bacterium]|nr:VOC family protein [Caulobacteraceae bacterium]
MQLGHVGIYVSDFDTMLSFYQSAFGFVVTDSVRSEQRALAFLTRDASSHHQFVLFTGRPEGVVSSHLINQISFKLDKLSELQKTYFRLIEAGAQEIDPITHGTAWSVYFRDPEGNRLEVYVETPWYITQPHRTPIDLTKPIDQIYAETEALCRMNPSFQPMRDWRLQAAAAIAAL